LEILNRCRALDLRIRIEVDAMIGLGMPTRRARIAKWGEVSGRIALIKQSGLRARYLVAVSTQSLLSSVALGHTSLSNTHFLRLRPSYASDGYRLSKLPIGKKAQVRVNSNKLKEATQLRIQLYSNNGGYVAAPANKRSISYCIRPNVTTRVHSKLWYTLIA
jgi:hypothetical protein